MKNDVESKERNDLFKKFDIDGNGDLDFFEIRKGLKELLNTDRMVNIEPAILNSFKGAVYYINVLNEKETSKNVKKIERQNTLNLLKDNMTNKLKSNASPKMGDFLSRYSSVKKQASAIEFKSKTGQPTELIKPEGFRLMLVQFRQFMEIWLLFQEVGMDEMDIEEFKEALERLDCWGIHIDNAEQVFALIDIDGGGLLDFNEFSDFIIKQQLDNFNETL